MEGGGKEGGGKKRKRIYPQMSSLCKRPTRSFKEMVGWGMKDRDVGWPGEEGGKVKTPGL